MRTLRTYQDDAVGRGGIGALSRFELATVLASPCPGAIGYALRKALFPGLFRRCGRGAQFGRGLTVLHPNKIEIGDNFGIDDNGLLDARKVNPGEFTIGDRALIAREVCIVARTERGSISIGDNCMISRKCTLASSNGIKIGSTVAIGSMSVIGGGQNAMKYSTQLTTLKGVPTDPVVIGDDCILGEGVYVADGVTIGRGSLIGAGTVVDHDIPEYTVATGCQQLEMHPRDLGN